MSLKRDELRSKKYPGTREIAPFFRNIFSDNPPIPTFRIAKRLRSSIFAAPIKIRWLRLFTISVCSYCSYFIAFFNTIFLPFVTLDIFCGVSRERPDWTYVQSDLALHTQLILLCTLSCSIINSCQPNPFQRHLNNYNVFVY